jgi:hypothetical protein
VVVVSIFKKDNSALVNTNRSISILNNFSKISGSTIHNHLSFKFKFKLYPGQHGFITSKSMETNLVTSLNDVIPSACSQ